MTRRREHTATANNPEARPRRVHGLRLTCADGAKHRARTGPARPRTRTASSATSSMTLSAQRTAFACYEALPSPPSRRA